MRGDQYLQILLLQKILTKVTNDHKTGNGETTSVPKRGNIRGKDFYK